MKHVARTAERFWQLEENTKFACKTVFQCSLSFELRKFCSTHDFNEKCCSNYGSYFHVDKNENLAKFRPHILNKVRFPARKNNKCL